MKARDLFIIILKVFGIYLLKDVLISIAPVFYESAILLDQSRDMALFSFFISLLVFVIHSAIAYVLLFHAGWIVSKLKLTSDLSEEPMALNLHRSSVYTIAIIVAGFVVLAFSAPQLVRSIYRWSQYRDAMRSLEGVGNFDYSTLLIPFTEMMVGLLFIGNQRTIVNFIESRRRKATVEG